MSGMDTVIIGSGIAGIAAGHILKTACFNLKILEKCIRSGGLSASFQVGGEWFDIAAHVLFARDSWVRDLLDGETISREFPFVAYNYKKGKWIKNPVQNNLFQLDTEEKIRIIKGFIEREEGKEPRNYREWLRESYGEYFSVNYPEIYTRKYWTIEAQELETKWVGHRMYRPSLEEVLRGAFSEDTEEVHYTGKVRYPVEGGFGTYFRHISEGLDIVCNRDVVRIDTKNHRIECADGQMYTYDYLISTAPIKEAVGFLERVPDDVNRAAEGLHATGLVLVSILVDGQLGVDYRTFYVYDEEIPAARVYSCSLLRGTETGKSSIQAEVYFSEFKPLTESMEEIRDKMVDLLAQMGCYKKKDVLETDVRLIPYANIIFTPNIYRDRKIVRDYIEKQGILCAGRFGEWDYFWTEQAMLSGKRAAEKVIRQIQKCAS